MRKTAFIRGLVRPLAHIADGVKALPMHRDRSPSPGGTTEGPGTDDRPWGVRRGVRKADGGVLESGCGFVLYDADGESVMRHECPEYRGGKAESGKQKVEIGRLQIGIPEMPESRCCFILHVIDGELLMRQECPEMGRKG